MFRHLVPLSVGLALFSLVSSSVAEEKNLTDPKTLAAKAGVEELLTHLQMYEVFAGTLPSHAQGLQALVAKPASEPIPKRWKQLLKQLPKDPWGHDYHYVYPGTRSKNEQGDVFSAGPDGKPNTADDIGNW